MAINIETIDASNDHIVVFCSEPSRIELSTVDGSVILHAYRGTEVDQEQDPDAVYDGTVTT